MYNCVVSKPIVKIRVFVCKAVGKYRQGKNMGNMLLCSVSFPKVPFIRALNPQLFQWQSIQGCAFNWHLLCENFHNSKIVQGGAEELQ